MEALRRVVGSVNAEQREWQRSRHQRSLAEQILSEGNSYQLPILVACSHSWISGRHINLQTLFPPTVLHPATVYC